MPKRKKGAPSKSDFIRQHADLPVSSVVTKAKESGISLTSTLVYKVRGRSAAKESRAKRSVKKGSSVKPAAKVTAKKGAKKKATAKPVAKKSAAKRGPKPAAGGVSASDFIRSLPATLSPKEVVAKGAEKGIKFSTNLVYGVRGASGSKGKKKSSKGRRAAPTAGASKASTRGGADPATILSNLVVEHGIRRVQSILGDVEKRVAKLLKGQ